MSGKRRQILSRRNQHGLVCEAFHIFGFCTMMMAAMAFTRMRTHNMYGYKMNRAQALHASKNSASGAIKKAYNDNALFNFHMMTQAQKIRDYSAMDTFVNTQSLWNLAWHDSFVRNGLSDFVPPMTGELKVLVVGGHNPKLVHGEVNALQEDVDNQIGSSASIARRGNRGEEQISQTMTKDSSELKYLYQKDSSCSFLTSIFINEVDDVKSDESSSDALEFSTYDCIMDEGLIADLVMTKSDNGNSNKNMQDIARLMFEATKRIREMGIYVANTQPMSSETKQYLQQLGDFLGLQWEFDLDGISDENLSVSVARKFGSCPEIGWQTMARMLEE